jgi:hypothetical protein
MARDKEENRIKPQSELCITDPRSGYRTFVREKRLQCNHEVYLHARKRGFKSGAPNIAAWVFVPSHSILNMTNATESLIK